MAEKGEVKAKKGGRGRPIQPGQVLNPGGRPKMPPEVRAQWQALADKCLAKLQVIADQENLPHMTLVKITELAADRGYGKAVQAIELGGADGGSIGFRFVDPPARSPE